MAIALKRNDATTSGVGDYETSDLARRSANYIRIGRVAEADYDKGLIRIGIQEDEDGQPEITTDWLPWVTQRAGNDRFWWAPEVGEPVVLLSPSGELAQGFALPAAFSTDYPANGDKATVQRTTFADGAVLEYDREAHRYTVDLTDCEGAVLIKAKTVTVQSTGEVTINGSQIHLNP
jgi:phage baseplate assembly protein V